MDTASTQCEAGLDGFRIDYVYKHKAFRMPAALFSRCYRIYYQISGGRNFFIEDRAYPIRAGDLALIGIGDLHKPDPEVSTPFDWILLSFSPDFIKSWVASIPDADLFCCFNQKVRQLRLDRGQQTYVESLFVHIADEVEQRQPGYLTAIRLNLMELLLFTARSAGRNSPLHRIPLIPIGEKVTLAAQYICQNYARKISLESIACMHHISYYYFCRAFRQITGYTLTEYINSVRVKRAEQLLRETHMSVTAVALAVGFESSTNFGRVFKSMTHLSPLRYRMRWGEAENAKRNE